MTWREEYAISKEKAKAMIDFDEEGMAHTFYNGSFGLIGGDRSRDSLLADIENCHHCEETENGGLAQKMGHGLVIFPRENCARSDLLFVATKPKSSDNGNYPNKKEENNG